MLDYFQHFILCKSITTMATYREKVRENLSCPVCYDTFDDGDRLPKGLPCYHTLCLACLDKYVENNRELKQNHLCPVCQAKFSVPDGGVNAIPNNPGFMGMLELVAKEDPESSEGASGAEDQAAKDQKVEMPKCAEHGDATCFLYCMECYVPLCAKCMTVSKKHNGHKLEDIASVTVMNDIEKNVNEFHQIVNDFDAFSEETLSKIFKQKSEVTDKIKQDIDRAAEKFFHKCKGDVDSHFENVLQKFNDFTNEFNEKRCDFENILKRDGLWNAIPNANTNEMVTELKSKMNVIRSLNDKIPEMKSIPSINTDFNVEGCFKENYGSVEKSTVQIQTDLSIACAETMTNELTLTSVPIKIPSGTVDLHLNITNLNAFVQKRLNDEICTHTWYVKEVPWRVYAEFNLPGSTDYRFPDKKKPVLFVGVRCEDKRKGWKYTAHRELLFKNYKNGYWESHYVSELDFTPRNNGWGCDTFTKEWLMSAENPYVKDNAMHICVMLTVVGSNYDI